MKVKQIAKDEVEVDCANCGRVLRIKRISESGFDPQWSDELTSMFVKTRGFSEIDSSKQDEIMKLALQKITPRQSWLRFRAGSRHKPVVTYYGTRQESPIAPSPNYRIEYKPPKNESFSAQTTLQHLGGN